MTDPAATVYQGRNWLSFKPEIAKALAQCDRLEAEADRPATSDFVSLRTRFLACLTLTGSVVETVSDLKSSHLARLSPDLAKQIDTDLADLTAAVKLPPDADEAALGTALDQIWQLASRVSDDLIRLEGDVTG